MKKWRLRTPSPKGLDGQVGALNEQLDQLKLDLSNQRPQGPFAKLQLMLDEADAKGQQVL